MIVETLFYSGRRGPHFPNPPGYAGMSGQSWGRGVRWTPCVGMIHSNIDSLAVEINGAAMLFKQERNYAYNLNKGLLWKENWQGAQFKYI